MYRVRHRRPPPRPRSIADERGPSAHHDGRYGANLEYSGGWSFWAHGYVPDGARFWTAIDDQPANPWN